MNRAIKYIFAFATISLLLTACDNTSRRYKEANILYKEGVGLRKMKQSEKAADVFNEALTVLLPSDKSAESLILEGDIRDNLGAMYWKHGLNDDAMLQHQEALSCFKLVSDSAKMMTALRNCGRVSASGNAFIQSKAYYDSAFQIAKTINDIGMMNDLNLEIGRDYYMQIGENETAIELVEKALGYFQTDTIHLNDENICHLTLGILFYKTNNYAKAKAHLNKALKSEKSGMKMTAYQTLYAIAYNEGDLKSAMEFQDLFAENMIQSDKEHNSETTRRIKAEYDLKNQKSQIETMHQMHDMILYIAIAISLLLLIAIILFVKKLRFKHKLLEAKGQMATDKVLLDNKIIAIAKTLGEQINASSLDFSLDDADWTDFINTTDIVYDGFTKRLTSLYPNFTKWDVRISCLVKHGFSNKVIAILIDTRPESYYHRKIRIKQKMNVMDDDRSFEEIICSI